MIPSPVGSFHRMTRGSPTLSLIFNVHHLLYGRELDVVGRSHIVVENGVIKEIGAGWVNDAHYSGGIAIPLPVNAHIHLNDYRALDHHYGYSLSQYVGSKGLKHALIRLYKEPLIADELLYQLIQYPYIVDYQEDYGLCRDYEELLSRYGTRYIGLSRLRNWWYDELDAVLEYCTGIGISNPTRIPPWRLLELKHVSRDTIVSAHVSETRYMEETGGLHYLLSSGVTLKHVVHGVFLEDWEFKVLADNDIVLVVTPRSNIWFLDKLPDVEKAFKHDVRIALGTDNTGCFHPDVWVEAHTLLYLKKIRPKKLLEMLLWNGYYAIGREPYPLEEGSEAYFMVIDLGLANERSGNIYLSLINRVLWSKRMVIVKRDKVYVLDKLIRRYTVV